MKWLRYFPLIIHLFAYGVTFLGVAFANTYVWSQIQPAVLFLMLWTPVLLLHVAFTFRRIGHREIRDLERDAYRDGYGDAMRHLADRAYDERLALKRDDEDELVDLPEKRKRNEG